MNTKRLVLYALLGVVCFALWDAWQKDFPTTSLTQILNPSAVENANVATVANTVSTTAAQTHTTVAISRGRSISTTQNNVETSSSVIAPTPQERLVKVHTDVLDVAIDTLGGKIVQTKLLQYSTLANKSSSPVQLFSDNPEKLYVADSGLISTAGPDTELRSAQYTVLQQHSQLPQQQQHEYTLQPEQSELQVTLQWRSNEGILINKTFTFKRGQYDVRVNYTINNQSSQVWTGAFYAQLQRKNIKEAETGSKLQYGTFAGAALSSPDKIYEKIDYKKLAKENINREVQGGWLALQQRYFLGVWIPEQNKSYLYFSKVSGGNNSGISTSDNAENIYTLGLKSDIITVPNGATANVGATLYAGPEIAATLKSLAPGLDLTIDYGWLWIISVFLFWVMQQIQHVVGNWGWSIILVTVLIKAAFFKLSEVSYRSMAKMKDLAPKLQALKERCGDDRQKLSQATMELYKKEKVNPLSGCLPMIVQIPVFIGLYYVLIEAIQLRHAPFMFWLHDLSAKDQYYVLPILMGASMFVQQLLSPQSPDPVQSKMMMALPIVFTVFFLNFPSGLVLYWLVNNVLSIMQQWYINKKYTHTSNVTPSLATVMFDHVRKRGRKDK